MKIWEKLLNLDPSIGYNREMAIEIHKTNSRCPAIIESKYNLLGNTKFEKFCAPGCGVNCVNEYLDLSIKG